MINNFVINRVKIESYFPLFFLKDKINYSLLKGLFALIFFYFSW